jgi:hypothetical protein
LGITPIALYYRISIAQIAGSIGTTTQNMLDFLASKTERQVTGNDIQGFYLVFPDELVRDGVSVAGNVARLPTISLEVVILYWQWTAF